MSQLIINPRSLFQEDAFDHFLRPWFQSEPSSTHDHKHYNIDEGDDTVTVSVDVPGYKKKELSIDYKEDVLTITNTQASDTRNNIRYAFKVPEISIDTSTAKLQDGVLTVTLQKAAEAKKQSIQIG
jgi:HSP20 family molecular chaperone IbpA